MPTAPTHYWWYEPIKKWRSYIPCPLPEHTNDDVTEVLARESDVNIFQVNYTKENLANIFKVLEGENDEYFHCQLHEHTAAKNYECIRTRKWRKYIPCQLHERECCSSYSSISLRKWPEYFPYQPHEHTAERTESAWERENDVNTSLVNRKNKLHK